MRNSGITKAKAIECLDDLLARAEGVVREPRWSPEFKKWYRDAQAALRNLFGAESAQLTDLMSIKFNLSMYTSSTPESTFDRAFRRGLDSVVACLASAKQEVEQYWSDDVASEPDVSDLQSIVAPADPRRVFVVHGRNSRLRDSLFDFLRSIGLNPIEWTQAVRLAGAGAPYVGEILDAAFAEAQAIVVLITPDDEAKLREPFLKPNDPAFERNLTGQARPNVLFEAGMAFGRHPGRTVLVMIGEVRPFSDVAGRHVLHLTNSTMSRQELANRLETCGCAVDLTGTDWHRVGSFGDDQCDLRQPGTGPVPVAEDVS